MYLRVIFLTVMVRFFFPPQINNFFECYYLLVDVCIIYYYYAYICTLRCSFSVTIIVNNVVLIDLQC